MQKRKLGNSNLEVSAVGLGCMRMSHDESPLPDRQEMITFLHKAVERVGEILLSRDPGAVRRNAVTPQQAVECFHGVAGGARDDHRSDRGPLRPNRRRRPDRAS